MELQALRLDHALSREITAHGSRAASQALLAGGTVVVSCIRLGPGGVLGRHAASAAQLCTVVAGSGWVAGGDGGRRQVDVGAVVCWGRGELHESGTETGMTLLVVEGDGLEPATQQPS